MQKIKIDRAILLAALVLVMAGLQGCATESALKPETTADATAHTTTVTETAAVTVLDDHRDGFTITEIVQMEGSLRKDFERAVALLEKEDNEGAAALLEAIVVQSPVVTAPYVNLGIAYQRMDKMEKAEVQFKKALELVPGHPVASNQFGLLCRKVGRFAEARAIYEQALAGYPNYYPVYRNLGVLCDLYLNEPENALAHYQTYGQAMPEDKQVKVWIADLKTRLGVQ